MNIRNALAVSGNVFTYILTAVQTDEVFKIIQLVLSILISLAILGEKIFSWYKKAKEDGTISKDEIKEGIDIISDGAKDVVDKIEEIKKVTKKDNKEDKN